MKKSSQWTLGAGMVLFLAAGTIKFWPEDRFLPSAPTFTSGSFAGGGPPSGMGMRSSAEMLPVARSFAPGWAEAGAPHAAPDKPKLEGGGPASPVLPQGHPALSARTGAGDRETKKHSFVSLTAQKMPVGEVLARLFHQAGVSFALTGQWDEPMTITFADAPMEQALSQTLLLTTHPRLSYHKENGVYIVMPVAVLPQNYPQNTNPFR